MLFLKILRYLIIMLNIDHKLNLNNYKINNKKNNKKVWYVIKIIKIVITVNDKNQL